MTAKTYGEAFYEAIRSGTAVPDALRRLKAILARNGHESLYAGALRDAQARFEKDDAREIVAVTLARKSDEKRFSKDIAHFLKECGAKDARIAVDADIIGGFIARGAEQELDASHRKSLLTLYRSLIA